MGVYLAIWLGLGAGAALLLWLARRALRLRARLARWGLAALAGLPCAILALLTALVAIGYVQFYRPREAPPLQLADASGPAAVARGAYLARTTCAACHSESGELPLSGGPDLSSHSPLPVGVIVPPNLTPGGPITSWSDQEIAQIIRNGLNRDGRATLMPTESLRHLSDDDIAAIIAYLRSQPAVQREAPPTVPSPLLAAFFGAGLAQAAMPPSGEPVSAPPHEASAAYGAYIASYQDCATCHGADLEGSEGGLGPAAPSARAFARAWTLEQFIQTMRTGVDPGGRPIADPMPWRSIGKMDDTDLAALYTFLRDE